MLATQLIPAGALAATYSAELEGAYNWAYSKGVTTMSSIDNANMYGAMTRAEMAKMISVYAVEVLGMTPDTSRACNFSDIDSVKGDLHDYIIKSCQLGIMGQGISAFRPYDTLPRAEFGTALSRLLWGNKYDGGTPYYVNHLNALKAAGIMNNISNAESTKEVRGYVMLMLQRSEALAGGSSSDTSDCDDPMVKVACSMDTDACPAACKTSAKDDEPTVVKAGDLAVTATAAAGRKAIIGAVSDLDTLKFRTSENVEITKVVLERYGYSSKSDVAKVWLEDENGNVISSEASVGSRDQASLSIKKDYRAVDGTLNATIVVRLNKPVSGDSIWFKVVDAESTAENLNLDDYTPYEYSMVEYSATSDVSIDSKGSDRTYNYEEGEMYEVAKMKVNNKWASAVTVNGFTLVQNGAKAMKLKDFVDEVEVTIDGDAVKAEWSIAKAGDLNVSLKDGFELDAKSNAVFTVSVALADFDKYGETINLTLTGADFKATEKKTGVRITPTVSAGWPTYTFAGSKIKLSNNKLGNLEYGQGSSDIVVAEWTITLSEPVEKVAKAVKFVVTGNYYDSGSNTFTGAIIEEMRVLVAWEEYTATPVVTASGATFTFSDMEIEKSGKFRVEVDLNTDEDAPAGSYVNFEGAFDDAVFSWAEYSDNGSEVKADEVSGVISFAKKLTVQAWRASFTNSLTKSVEFLTNDTDTKTVFDGTYTAKKNDVNLTEFVMSGVNTLTGTKATFYLYVDGKNVADVRLSDGVLTWADQISKVKIAAGESATIRVDAELSVKAFTGNLGKFYVTLNGEDDNNNAITTSPKATVEVKVVEAESVKLADATAARAKDILLRGSAATLAQFRVKSSNGGSVKFDNGLKFTGTYGSTSANYKAEDLVVTLGKTELECEDSGTTIVCESDATLDGEGEVITIALNDTAKAEWNVSIRVTEVNGDSKLTKDFSKRFLDAVVRIEKQEWKKATTVFTLSVETYDDVEDPTGIAFYPFSGSACSTTAIYENTWEKLSDGKTITLTNDKTAAMVCGVAYGYSWTAYVYTATKLAEEDYFKQIPTLEGSTSSNDDLMVNNVD